jgi:hypothetical protein
MKGKTEQTEKKHTHCYEQKCQSHTCSGTINSSMYDSDLTATTSWLTLSAPYSGQRLWQASTCKLSFCCNSRSNGKTQPYYWLATDHNNKDKKKTDRHKGKEKLKERRTGKYYEQVGLEEAPHLQDSEQNPGIFL